MQAALPAIAASQLLTHAASRCAKTVERRLLSGGASFPRGQLQLGSHEGGDECGCASRCQQLPPPAHCRLLRHSVGLAARGAAGLSFTFVCVFNIIHILNDVELLVILVRFHVNVIIEHSCVHKHNHQDS